jgi:phospholipid/cholesterol/gamma-HCH transport system substrate-binding protein
MTGNRNLSVGLFVTVALLAGTILAIWVTGQRGSEPVSRYSVLVEDNVSGLMLGGPVFFLGVRVGEVTDLRIVPGRPVRIRVDLRVLASTPVNEHTWATLAPQGITGVSVVNLANDNTQQTPLETPPGQDFPVIPFRDSGFSALLSSAPAVIEQLETLLLQANQLFNDDNRAAISTTLANLQSLSSSLRDKEASLAALPDSIDASLQEINRLSAQLSGLLNDAGPGVLASISNIETTTGQLASTAQRLEQWAADNHQAMDAFVGDGLGQLPALITNANSAVRELEKLLGEIRSEPSALVRENQSEAIEWER